MFRLTDAAKLFATDSPYSEKVVQNSWGLFGDSHPHVIARQQGALADIRKFFLRCLTFAASIGSLKLQLPCRFLAMCCLALTMMLFGGIIEAKAVTVDYHWLTSGNPKETVMFVNRSIPESAYPYMKGKVTELAGVGADRYYELRVIHRSPHNGEWWTTDRDDINTTSKWPNEGGEHVTCNGEEIFGRKRVLYYGTWYYQTRTLSSSFHGSFHFWFCPNKTNLDNLGTSTSTYYTAKLEIKYRYKSGSSWKTSFTNSDMRVTVFRTADGKPDLKWEGGDRFVRRVVADGSQRYDDLFGYAVTNSKPANSDRISAVQEKWRANGRSFGTTNAVIGELREEVGRDDFGGQERPLGDNLQYGTWFFSNNYQRFMFRPDAEAANRLLPGERVRSHATYEWVLPICHSCPHRVIASDTARVEIVREGANLIWDRDVAWTDNEIGKLKYDESNPLESVSGRTWIYLPSESEFTVAASDTSAASNNGMPEELQSAASTESGFSTEYVSSYGRWKWRDNNVGFTFEPDWVAVNSLGNGKSASTTLELKIVKSGQELYKSAVTVTVHGTTTTVVIDDVTLAEGNGGGSTDFQFTVKLSVPAALNQTFTVPVEFSHGTTDAADFVSGTANGLVESGMLDLNFGATETEKTITIQVNADDVRESRETFTLTLREPTGNARDMKLLQFSSVLASNVGRGTISDDDRAYVSIDDILLAEGNGGGNTEFQFTVNLTPATAVNQAFTVPISFAHVTTNNDDFVGDPTQTTFDVSFGAADTSKPVSVMVNKDGVGEGVEQFTLTLSEPTGTAKDMNLVALNADPDLTVGTGTITNDDNKKLILNWLDGFDGEIVSDGTKLDYGYKVAYYRNHTPYLPTNSFTETKNGAVINSHSSTQFVKLPFNPTPYPEFTGLDNIYVLGANSAYGQWFMRFQNSSCDKHCRHVLFVPNVSAINQLQHGDVVTSTYTRQTWHEGYDISSLTVTIKADLGASLVGFDYDSRNIEVVESQSAELDVFISESRESPVTIPFTVSAAGSAEPNTDFVFPSNTTLTIPSGETRGKISISILNDSISENLENFKVSLLDGTDSVITPVLQTATISIVDDDAPEIVEPGGKACDAVTKPTSVATPNTEAYWKVGAPEVDGAPIVYREAGRGFDVQLGFRDHGTDTESTPNAHNTFYFGVYHSDGTPENLGIPLFALSSANHVEHHIRQPGSFRGYLSYRILARNTPDNLWYYVGDPCEFHIWWTDRKRPGITMSIEQETVHEGNTFRVVATATPAPNRDILVPFKLSNDSRIEDSQVHNITIKAGQTSGHRDIHTKFLANDQSADKVAVTAEWTHNYWLDDTKKMASVEIVDHNKKLVGFMSSDLETSVPESGNAELVVELESPHTADLTVEYRIDDQTAIESADYTAPNPTHITIPAGSSKGTISIAIIPDTGNPVIEESKSFTVTLIETIDAIPRNLRSVATVTILDDDRPAVVTPGNAACDAVTKPATVAVPNTEAYWGRGAPVIDGLPTVYRAAGDEFEVRIGFRDPTTKAESTPNFSVPIKMGVYLIDGTAENANILTNAHSSATGVNREISEPMDFRGYLRYRILTREAADQYWYHVGKPCEFHLWWTDANRPGVALSITDDSVSEGNFFRVTATATPAPNRDIFVPIAFSDISRLADSPSRTVRIKAGQTSGHAEILTKYIGGDQTLNRITVSTEWRSSYWLDESVKSAEISITESTLPVLSVSAGDTVTEADDAVATFNVSSDLSDGATEIEVNYTVTETGDFLRAPDPNNPDHVGHINNQARNATMKFTDRSETGDGSGPFIYTLEIPIRDNSALEPGSQSITVTLNADTVGTNYELSTNFSASVNIIDDDSLPVLTLEADSNILAFDEPNSTDTVKHITFMVTATATTNPGTLQNVQYTPSEIGNFIDDTNGNTPGILTQATLNFSGSGGTFTAPLEIPIVPDVNPEVTGTVTVTLLNPASAQFHYKLGEDTEKHSWTVTVYDNDIPELTIHAPALEFVEGSSGEINFTVTARFNVVGTMTVNFSVTEFSPTDLDTPLTPHTYVNSTFASPEVLEFNDSTHASLNVPIVDDSVAESDRVVRVTLIVGNSTEYTVASLDSGGRTDITVEDDDGSPLISISAPESVRESDGTIEFTVSAASAPRRALDVGFTLTERNGDDYLSTQEEARTSVNLTLEDIDGDSVFTKNFTVNLANDQMGEPTGLVTLTLDEDIGNYMLDDATKSATVKVYDDDVPELQISEYADTGRVLEAEGAMARFKLVASFLPESPVTVHYTPVSANFLTAGASGVKASAVLSFNDESTAGEGPYTANLEVSVDNDDTTESHGPITVTLNDDDPINGTYTVDAENNAAAVEIRDDESKINLTVDGPESVLESTGTVVFIVTAHAPANPGNDYAVAFALSQTGNFLSSQYEASTDGRYIEGLNFTTSGAAFTATLTLDLDDDDTSENSGTVKVQLGASTGDTDDYALGRRIEHTVKVFDDDAPLVWIEPILDNVVAENGAMSSFMLYSRAPVSEPINYRVDQSSFVDNIYTGKQTTAGNFNDPVGSSPNFTKQINIPLLNDNIGDAQGSVTITLLRSETGNNPGYMLATDDSESPNSATVQVFNVNGGDSFATVDSGRKSVTEGEDIIFNISIIPTKQQVVEVRLKVNKQGDFIPWPVPDSIMVPPAGAKLKIPTSYSDEAQNGLVTVEILPGQGYQSGGSDSVTITHKTNNDESNTKYSVVSSVITAILSEIPPTPPQGESQAAIPTVSIKALTGTVAEGELAVFAISATRATGHGIPIRIELSQSGDFISGLMHRSVALQANELETEFAVATDNDGLAEADGRITATILAGSEYLVGSQNTAHVTVSDALDRKHRKTSVATAMNAILPDLLAHSTARTLAIANNRIAQGFSGSSSTSIELNGKSPAMTALQSGGEMLNGNNTDWQSLIDDSSFTVALYPEGSETSPATVWGVGDKWNLSNRGNGGQQSWDGETYSGHFGFDAHVGRGMLAGLAMSVSQSEIGYGQNGNLEMSFDSLATGLHPYLGISTSDGNSRIQIVAGYGENELELKQKEYSPEILSVHYDMVAIGGSGNVYSFGSFGGLQNLELNVAGEAWHARQFVDSITGVVDNLQVDARHVRIAVEESHDHNLGNIGTLSPSFSIGLWGDGRNNKSVFGLNLGNGIKYAGFDGLEVSGTAKSMLYGLNRLHRWEIGSSLDYDFGNDNQGLLLSMTPAWSGTDSDFDRYIWDSEFADASNGSIGSYAQQSVTVEIGYGFEVLRGSAVLTPFHAFKHANAYGSEFRVGGRMKTETGIGLELGVVRDIPTSGTAGREVNMAGYINW